MINAVTLHLALSTLGFCLWACWLLACFLFTRLFIEMPTQGFLT